MRGDGTPVIGTSASGSTLVNKQNANQQKQHPALALPSQGFGGQFGGQSGGQFGGQPQQRPFGGFGGFGTGTTGGFPQPKFG